MRHTETREPGEIRRQALENGVLAIVYKCGDGKITMNLSAILPATAGDMKKIISFVDLSARPAFYAEVIHEYIRARVDRLKKERAGINPEKKEYARITKEIKKYIRNAAMLSKLYGLPEVSDDEEEQRTEQPAADPEKERAGIILKGEKNMMKFKKDSITVNGKTFPCEYSVTESGAILVFAIVGEKADGRKEKQRIRIEEGNPHFAAAMKAAKQAGAVKATKKAAAKKAEPAPEVKTETAAAPEAKTEEPAPVLEPVKAEEPAGDPEPVKAAADPKQARGPVKEKDFIGKEITGNGWRILFDAEKERTRVIFDNTPEPAAKQAIEEARFFWSPNMGSFNKKLTFKAYRAAVKLADVLNEIYAA